MMFTYLIVRKTHKFSNFLFNMPLGLTSVYLVAKFHHLVTKKNGALTFIKGFMGGGGNPKFTTFQEKKG